MTYDVVVYASYNGLLSDPFYIFINRPSMMIKGVDPSDFQWVHTSALYNGYSTHVNYEVQSLCSADGSMTNYHFNEQFASSSIPDYPNSNWPNGSAGGENVPSGYTAWFDQIASYNDGAAPDYPAYCISSPPSLCIPPWRNPGPGDHTLADHRPQSWYVGSMTPGIGARVQSNTLQRYTDSGYHAAIITPNP